MDSGHPVGDGAVDTGPDAPQDASPDGTGDAQADAAPCPPIAAACADGGALASQCVQSWSIAEQASTWCPMFPYVRVIRAMNCDGFDIVALGATDTSSFYYYDPGTGDLLGIEGHGNLGTQCLAGVSPDVPLTDCVDSGTETFECQADGSVGE